MKFLLTLLLFCAVSCSFSQLNQNDLKFKVFSNGQVIPEGKEYRVIPVIDAHANHWIKRDDGYAYEQWKFRHFRRDNDWFIFDFERSGRYNREPAGLMILIEYNGQTMYISRPVGLDSISFRPGVFSYNRAEAKIDTLGAYNQSFYPPEPKEVKLYPAKTFYSLKSTIKKKLWGVPLTYRGLKSNTIANTGIEYWHFERSYTVALYTDYGKRKLTRIPLDSKIQALSMTTNAPDSFNITSLNFSIPLDSIQPTNWAQEPLLSLYVHSDMIFTKNWAIWHLTDLDETGGNVKPGTDKFYISKDNGVHWKKLPIKMERIVSMSQNNGVVLIEDGESFYCLHQSGRLVKSIFSEEGKYQSRITSNSYCFINEYLGYMLASANSESCLLKTDNGGKSWSRILNGSGYYKLSATKDLLVVEVAPNDFFTSKNEGVNWARLDLNEITLEREEPKAVTAVEEVIVNEGRKIVGIQLTYNNYQTKPTYDSLKVDQMKAQKLFQKDKSKISTYHYKYYSGIKKGRYYESIKDTINRPKITFSDSTFKYEPLTLTKANRNYSEKRYNEQANAGKYHINDSIITFYGNNTASWFHGSFNYGFEGHALIISHPYSSGSFTFVRLDQDRIHSELKKLDLKLYSNQQRYTFTPEHYRIYITVTNGDQIIKDAVLTYGKNKVRFDANKEQWFLDSRLVAQYRPDYHFNKTAKTGVNLIIEHSNYAKKTIQFNLKGSHLYQISSE
jgi:hypothetical protein